MAPSTVLRRLTVGVALIVALAACGSTAVPTTAPTVVPTVAPAVVPTVSPTVAPTATSTATPTAVPTATPIPTAWSSTGASIVKAFTDKSGLTFATHPATGTATFNSNDALKGKTYVTVTGRKSDDKVASVTVYDSSKNAAVVKEMTDATGLMVDPAVASEATAWVQSEYKKILAVAVKSGHSGSSTTATQAFGATLVNVRSFNGAVGSPTILSGAIMELKLSPIPTPVFSWKYTRGFVAKSFTDKFGLTFKGSSSDSTWVDSPFSATVSVSIQGLNSVGDSNVAAVMVMCSKLVAVSQEMTFAIGLMADPDVASEASAWVQSELAKANADKNTEVDDKTNIGSTHLWFTSNADYGSGQRGTPSLKITQAP